jgi:hypothetical protein
MSCLMLNFRLIVHPRFVFRLRFMLYLCLISCSRLTLNARFWLNPPVSRPLGVLLVSVSLVSRRAVAGRGHS